MPTDYLFTWKPGHWPYSELKRLVATFKAGRNAMEPWRCQAHRKIRIGDKAYMVKLGDAPRGIFGIGTVSGEPYRNPEASEGENPWLVPITFDLLVDPTRSLLMPESDLIKLDAPKHRWHPQGSGITLEENAARAIDRFVNRKNDFNERGDQIPQAAPTVEQRVRAIVPEAHLADTLGMVARSIQIADQYAPDKWGVRVSRKSIMLKVGFVEVLQFHNDLFHHLVRGDLVPKKARSAWRDNFYAAPYKNAPACDGFDADLSISKNAYELLFPAHEAAIEIAARSPIHTTTKRDHSPDLVYFISSMTKIPLSQPTYIESFDQTVFFLDEIADHRAFVEGGSISVLVNRYERDRSARMRCIEHHGTNCAVCGISFGDYYGSNMIGFIHIHHLAPLSSISEQRAVDPIRDLLPVCPNCHAVIHSSNPPLTIDEVRLLIERNGKI